MSFVCTCHVIIVSPGNAGKRLHMMGYKFFPQLTEILSSPGKCPGNFLRMREIISDVFERPFMKGTSLNRFK